MKAPTAELIKLTDLQLDALREIGYIGAGHAAKSLSELIGQRIDVKVHLAHILPLEELPRVVGHPETIVVGIYLPITGDLDGSVLIIFPLRSALNLADVVQARKIGTTKRLNEMDNSALKEVGNILSGTCLTALSKFLGMKLVEHVPDIACDMVKAVTDHVVIKFGHEAEQALVLGVEFKAKNNEKKKIEGYFFLLFGLKEAEVILERIEKKITKLE